MIQRFARLPLHARSVAVLLIATATVLCVLVVLKLAGWFWQHHQQIADLEPRIARLLGYKESVEELRTSVSSVNSQLDGLVFSRGTDASTAGAAVQQEVRRVLESSGMSVLGSQVFVDGTTHETLEEIRIDVTATGSMEALDQTLADLDNARPLLLLRTLELSPVNVRRGEARQDVSVALSLRAVRLL